MPSFLDTRFAILNALTWTDGHVNKYQHSTCYTGRPGSMVMSSLGGDVDQGVFPSSTIMKAVSVQT